MNSLERAKHFLARKASRLALAVVPLAAVAVSTPSAKAAAILNNSGGCDVTTGTGSCGIDIFSSGGNNHLNVASLFTSGAAVASGSALDFSGGLTSGGANGGTLNGKVPVSWDFDIIQAATSRTVDWTITFTLYGSGGSVVSTFSKSGSAASSSGSGTLVAGSGNLPSPSGSNIYGYSITLDTETASGKGSYSINIPADASLDLNPDTSTPEPSTLLLTIPGIGALLLLRRKKRS
jgi:hypothetical protein